MKTSLEMSNNSSNEAELGAAHGRLKKTMAQVQELKKKLEAFLKMLKNWSHCADSTCQTLTEAIDPERFEVGREISKWAKQQSELNERVSESLSETFNSAVLKPVIAWIDSFKLVKDVLKEYAKAYTSRKHYEEKVAKLKLQQMKGKAKPDKVQRNLRKLDSARSEYKRIEAMSIKETRAFFTKCHNNFVSVTAMFARFHERLGREFNNEWQANGPWAVKILRMKSDDLPPDPRYMSGSGAGGNGTSGRGSGYEGSGRDSSGSYGGGESFERRRDSQASASSSGMESNGRSSSAGLPYQGDSSRRKSSGSGNNNSSNDSNNNFTHNGSSGDNAWAGGDSWGETAPSSMDSASASGSVDGFDGWGANDGAGSRSVSGSNANANVDGFGDWDDVGTSRRSAQGPAPARPARQPSPALDSSNAAAVEDDGFGAFGDFGDGFSSTPPASAAAGGVGAAPNRPARKTSPSSTSVDDDGFGAFGDFGGMQASMPPSAPAPFPPQQGQGQQGQGQQGQGQQGQGQSSNPFLDFF